MINTIDYWAYAVDLLDKVVGTVEIFVFSAICVAIYGRFQIAPTPDHLGCVLRISVFPALEHLVYWN